MRRREITKEKVDICLLTKRVVLGCFDLIQPIMLHGFHRLYQVIHEIAVSCHVVYGALTR